MKYQLVTAIHYAMSRIRLLLILNALHLFLMSVSSLAQQSLPEELTATLSVDDNLARGGEITFIVEIRNVSGHRIVLMQERSPFESSHLTTYDRHGRRLAGYSTTYVDWNMNDRELLVKIDPGQTLKISFEGAISKDSGLGKARQTTSAPGPFIKFGNSELQAPQSGPCIVTFALEHNQELAKKLRKRLQEPDIWFGKVVSNPVSFEVPEEYLPAE